MKNDYMKKKQREIMQKKRRNLEKVLGTEAQREKAVENIIFMYTGKKPLKKL